MAHGNVYKPDRIDAALANDFRPGNLAALRELAFLWLADRVDEGLEEYREWHGITEPGRRASACSSRSPVRPAPRR